MLDEHSAQRHPQTLSEIWQERSLVASGWTVRHSLLTGAVAVAGIAFNQGRWSYSLLYLIAGCFGARAIATGPGRARARIRAVLDAVAVVATVLVALQVLKFMFGGSVGLFRA